MGGSVGGGRGRRGGIVGINVTPMVDVMLVLLVIMMVSSIYIVSRALKVELPKTASSDEAVSTVSAVTITKQGAYLYNGDPVTEPALVERLRAAKAGGAEVNLVLSADEEALHGKVVHVIDLAKIEGITKFAINVERSR